MSGLVLYAVIWFMTLFVTLPIRLETQGDRGEIVPGTMAGSPAHIDMRKRFKIVTVVAFGFWVVIAGIIFSGVITTCDFDWFDTMAEQCAAREAL
ncbi:DUF1467 family protein [Candidatus Rhodobacter oscarellae]